MPNLPYKSNAATWDTHSPVGQVRFDFPFVDDFSIYTVTRNYVGPLSTYAAPVLGTADATYTAHRLVAQSPLEPGDGGTVRYTRTWSPIPADHLTYAARLFPRPRLHDIVVAGGLSSIWSASFDDDTSTLFFARLSASVGAITPSTLSTAGASLPAATITITKTLAYGGGSFSFSTTDSAAAITAAYNAAWAAQNFYNAPQIVKDSGRMRVGSGYNYPQFAASCTSTGVQLSFADNGATLIIEPLSGVNTATPSVPPATRSLTTTVAHGAAAGDWLAAWNNNKLVGLAQVFTAPDAVTVTVKADESPWSVGALIITHVALAKNGLRLVHGAKDCSIRTTEKFYLPGVSAGIGTGADVPSVPLYTDPIAWLGRLAATTHTAVTATALTDLLTKTAHGLSTGDIFFVLAQTGAAGLTTLTPYYAIRSDANNFKAAVSHAAAVAGTALDITSDGTALTLLVPAPYAAIAVSDLRAWMGPILAKSYDEVQLLDAIEVRSASA